MSFNASLSEIVQENENGLLAKHQSWCRVELDEVASILNGFAFPSYNFSTDHGKPLLRIRDILSNSTETLYDGDYDNAYVVQNGDLVIGMDGDFNCTLWKGGKALLNQRVCKVTNVEQFYDRRFLVYILPGYLKAVNAKTSSVTVKHLSSGTIKLIPIPLPPIPEQQRLVGKIEELFTKLDSGVEALKKIQLQLKRYRQSVLKSAFNGELTAEWRKAHKGELEPASALLKKIKQEQKKSSKFKEIPSLDTTDLPELPEGWVWARVRDISSTIQYGTSDKANEDPSGIPVIRMGNIQEGRLDFKKLKYLPKEYPQIGVFLLQDGDILFNRTNSAELVGKSAVYSSSHPKAVFASYLIRIRIDGEAYTPEVLSYYINSFYGRVYINSVVSQQVGQANVNGTKLSLMSVPLFSLAEQKILLEEINLCFSVADKIEETITQSLKQSERLRQSILKKAFEGKLVTQNPDDEPAEKLLERVKAERTKILMTSK